MMISAHNTDNYGHVASCDIKYDTFSYVSDSR